MEKERRFVCKKMSVLVHQQQSPKVADHRIPYLGSKVFKIRYSTALGWYFIYHWRQMVVNRPSLWIFNFFFFPPLNYVLTIASIISFHIPVRLLGKNEILIIKDIPKPYFEGFVSSRGIR